MPNAGASSRLCIRYFWARWLLCLSPSLLLAADQYVADGGDLQAALNQAQGGDTITLQAGATFTGHFTLPANPSYQIITIQSSAMGSLPGPGVRVNQSQAPYMPKLVTPDSNAVLQLAGGTVAYYRLQGIEFAPSPSIYVDDLIQVGTGQENSPSLLPHNIDFDRCYIHGDLTPIPDDPAHNRTYAGAAYGAKRGIALNGGYTTVQNSYLSAFTDVNSKYSVNSNDPPIYNPPWFGRDTQALCGWNGPGPYRILNNYLEGGGEIVAFGGGGVSIQNNIPSDILIAHNDFFKPTIWLQQDISVKNHIELKNAQRVTIDSNTFTHNWIGGNQSGHALVFFARLNPSNGDGVPWAKVSDIQVTNNFINHAGGGIWFAAEDDGLNPTVHNIEVRNNRFEDISNANVGLDSGTLFTFQNGVQDITIDHNTASQIGWLELFDARPSRVYTTNNVFTIGAGIQGDNAPDHSRPAPGTATLQLWNPQGNFLDNDLIGSKPPYPYPPDLPYPGGPAYSGDNNYNVANEASAQPGRGANLASPYIRDVPTGWVSLVSKISGKCLDLPYRSGTNWGMQLGLEMEQWSCSYGVMQQFQFTPVLNGYMIAIKVTGETIDIAGGPNNFSNGARALQFPFLYNTNQIFQVVRSGDGDYLYFKPSHSGSCLDLATELSTNNGQDNGAAVAQWTCSGGDMQKWLVVPQ